MISKVLTDAIIYLIVTLTAMIGSFVVLNTWVKNRGINKKKLLKIEEENAEHKNRLNAIQKDIERIQKAQDGMLDIMLKRINL